MDLWNVLNSPSFIVPAALTFIVVAIGVTIWICTRGYKSH